MSYCISHILPFIETSQAQKETTHNEALRALDVTTNMLIIDRDLAAPPVSPSNGDTYLIDASATGDWAGEDGNIGYYYDGWSFLTPFEGLTGWVDDEDKDIIYSDGVWSEKGGVGSSGTFTPTLRGSTVNGTNTYGTREGEWEKVGNILMFWLTLEVTTVDGTLSGDLQITGVPESTKNVTDLEQVLTCSFSGEIQLQASRHFTCYMTHNSSLIRLAEFSSGTSRALLNDSDIFDNTTIYIQGTILT